MNRTKKVCNETGRVDETGVQREAEREVKKEVEEGHAENDHKKEAFVKQGTELNQKKSALAELEKQLLGIK
jgi:hypothetical protein